MNNFKKGTTSLLMRSFQPGNMPQADHAQVFHEVGVKAAAELQEQLFCGTISRRGDAFQDPSGSPA